MSVMDRFLSAMKFNDEDDEDDGFYDSGSDDDFQDKPPARKPAAVAERRNTASDEEDIDVSEKEQNPLRKITQKVTPINKPQPIRFFTRPSFRVSPLLSLQIQNPNLRKKNR